MFIYPCIVLYCGRMKSANYGGKEEAKGKRNILQLIHIIIEYNTNIRTGMTLK